MRNVSGLNNSTIQQAGQGDAYVFSPLDNSGLMNAIYANKADEARREKARADRDAQLADELKYNPKAIFSPYAKEHEAAGLKLIKDRADILKGGIIDPSHPKRLAYEKDKNQLEQNVAKGKEVQDLYPQAIGAAKDPYFHQEKVIAQINDVLHDESGNSRLPIKNVKPTDLYAPLQNPDNLNMNYAAQDFAKKLPEQVKSYITQQRSALGERFDENIVKSKFYKYDQRGDQIKDKQGNPVINITPEVKAAFYGSHPLIKPRIEAELKKPENQGLTEDDIIAKNISPYAYENKNTNVGGTTKWNTDGESKNKLSVQPAVITQKSANDINHNAPGVTIQKDGKPVVIPIPANTILNFSTGKQEVDNTDDVNVNVSALAYSLAHKKGGQMVAFDSPEAMLNYIKTAPKSELDKLDLNQYLHGTIEEKTKRQGDTQGDEEFDTTNKSVAIKYDPRGKAAGWLTGISGGSFNKRELTAGEKTIVDAWEERKKNVAPVQKPKESKIGW